MAVAGAFIVPHPPLIVPEIGRGEERKIQKTIDSYKEIAKEAAAMHPDTVVVLSPHSVMYRDYFHILPVELAKGDFSMFGFSQLQMNVVYDTSFVSELCSLAKEAGIAAGTVYRRGRLLPNLEGVDTVEQQIDTALRKAGIGGEEPYTIERFEVVRHY